MPKLAYCCLRCGRKRDALLEPKPEWMPEMILGFCLFCEKGCWTIVDTTRKARVN